VKRLAAELLALALVCPPACFGVTTVMLRWTATPSAVAQPNGLVQHYPARE
jgi:hypothetical protein